MGRGSLFSVVRGGRSLLFWVGKGDSLFSGMGGRLSGGRGDPVVLGRGRGGLRGFGGAEGADGSRGCEGVAWGRGSLLFSGRRPGVSIVLGGEWSRIVLREGGLDGGEGGQGGTGPPRGPRSPWGEGALAAPGEGGSPRCSRGWGAAQKGSSIVLCGQGAGGSRWAAGMGDPGCLSGGDGGSRLPSAGGSPSSSSSSVAAAGEAQPRGAPGGAPAAPGTAPHPGAGGDAAHGEERTAPGGSASPHRWGGAGHAERSGGSSGGSARRGRSRTGEPRGAPRSARVAPTGPPPAPRPPCGSRPVPPVLTGERLGAGQARQEQEQQRQHREQRRRRHGLLRCPSVPGAAERTGTSGEVPSKSEQPPVTKAPTAALAPPRDRPRGGRKPPAPPPPHIAPLRYRPRDRARDRPRDRPPPGARCRRGMLDPPRPSRGRCPAPPDPPGR